MKHRDHNATFDFHDPQGERKLRSLILYIADKCALHKRFGTVKLNKILFFSDFIAYATLGRAITGVEYLALEAGPAPRRMPAVKEAMFQRREIADQVRTVDGGYTEHRVVASTKPDLDLFSGAEIAIVDAVIEEFRNKTAADVSFLSHALPWRIGRRATGTIPYETAFVSDAQPTDFQIARGRELIEKHGWGA
jgi:hypothetical protein